MPRPPKIPSLGQLRAQPRKAALAVLGAILIAAVMVTSMVHASTATTVLTVCIAVIWITLVGVLLNDRRTRRPGPAPRRRNRQL